ncbi:barstar family protein [Inhella sp. 4Y17]|uniref:Barstar family protein n=1 Tax=Inhella gelatinilytica TaxID=2795030 RepID=A0A931ITM7_9BURK|nr:barstar family protein [Inhella gelatinilytica]
MLLQNIRPNVVQAIRAYRPEDLQQAAAQAGQHFLYAHLADAGSKQEVVERIAEQFMFPEHFGKNLDALYDCMTDLVHKSGPQPGFVVVLELLPDNAKFDRESREQLLDVFREAADYWSDRRIQFRCFYSCQYPAQEAGIWESRSLEPASPAIEKPLPKSAANKAGGNPNFGLNLPLMCSAFDTSAWLNAA